MLELHSSGKVGLEQAPSHTRSRELAIAESGGDAQCSLVSLTNYSNEEARWLAYVGKCGVAEIDVVVLESDAHVAGDD